MLGYRPDWYSSSFNQDYEKIYRITDDAAPREARQVLQLLGYRVPRGARTQQQLAILDVACGWGRHTMQFALNGHRVTGVDLNAEFLEEARHEAAENGISVSPDDAKVTPPESGVKFVKRDMRTLDGSGDFDVAVCLFTSFGYFSDPEENMEVLRSVHDCLKPRGQFLLDVDNPELYVTKGTGQSSQALTDSNGEGILVTKQSEFDFDRGRRIVRFVFDDPSLNIYLECQLYTLEALIGMLEDTGFVVSKTQYGNYDGQNYGSKSPRLIVKARKRA
jgi:SAM-dependent methyltransferase